MLQADILAKRPRPTARYVMFGNLDHPFNIIIIKIVDNPLERDL
jgi:hypothetical protein